MLNALNACNPMLPMLPMLPMKPLLPLTPTPWDGLGMPLPCSLASQSEQHRPKQRRQGVMDFFKFVGQGLHRIKDWHAIAGEPGHGQVPRQALPRQTRAKAKNLPRL